MLYESAPLFFACFFVTVLAGAALGQGSSGATPSAVDLVGDQLPQGALARLGTSRFRHRLVIRDLCVSPDGKLIASIGSEGEVRVWDSYTGVEVRKFSIDPKKGGIPTAVAFSPNGSILAAATPGVIYFWDTVSGVIIHELHGPRSDAISFSPDGRSLASIGLQEGITLWDAISGTQLGQFGPETYKGTGSQACSIAFSPNGDVLASCQGPNREVTFWNPVSRKLLRQVKVLEEGVERIAFSPDNLMLAASGRRGTICLWDVVHDREIRRFHANPGLTSIAFSPDGKTLASANAPPFMGTEPGGDENRLRLWDVTSGKQIAQLGDHSAGVHSVAFSKDGSFLVAGTGSAICKYDMTTQTEIGPVCGHTSTVCTLAFLPDGKSVATGSADHTLRFWDPVTGRETRRPLNCKDTVDSLAFSPAAGLLAAATQDGLIRFWDVFGLQLVSTIDVKDKTQPFRSGGISIAFSPDGTRVASISHLTPATIWELKSGKKFQEFGEGIVSDPYVAYSPSGKYLATGTSSALMGTHPPTKEKRPAGMLWNMAANKAGPALVGQRNRALSVNFSPDGELLAAATDTGIDVWKTATGTVYRQFKCPGVVTYAAAFSPDGRMIASTGDDKSVRLWEVLTGQERRLFTGHSEGDLWAVAFDPSGMTLASGVDDTTVLIWDCSNGRNGARKSNPSLEDLQRWWDDLAGTDAKLAYKSMANLIGSRENAVKFLREHLHASPAPQVRISELLAHLDSNKSTERERAMSALQVMGEEAEPILKKALADKPSLELRRRIQQLLEASRAPITDPVKLQALRSLEVLEHIGSAGLPVLEKLASGRADDCLTLEAQHAVSRMAKKRNAPQR